MQRSARFGFRVGICFTHMVFSSHLFIFYFLPLALLLYYAVPGRGKHAILTLLSYVFYGWANPLFVVLMLASTLIDYVCGLVIANQPWNQPIHALAKGGLASGGNASRSRYRSVPT